MRWMLNGLASALVNMCRRRPNPADSFIHKALAIRGYAISAPGLKGSFVHVLAAPSRELNVVLDEGSS